LLGDLSKLHSETLAVTTSLAAFLKPLLPKGVDTAKDEACGTNNGKRRAKYFNLTSVANYIRTGPQVRVDGERKQSSACYP